MNENQTPKGNKLYRALYRLAPKAAPWAHLVIFALALLALDLGFCRFFRYIEAGVAENARRFMPFTLGWALVFTGIAALLPRRARRVYMIVLSAVFSLLCVVHGIYINMFRRFFSFSDMMFAGDGAAFLDFSYLLMIRKLLLVWIVLCLALGVLAALLVPPQLHKARLAVGPIAAVIGIALILFTRFHVLGSSGAVIWNQNSDPAFLYEDFSYSRACLPTFGLYQYTFRDIQQALPKRASLSGDERQEIDAYAAGRAHEENAMSGVFEGKNLILVQLEAIDTWMLTEDYMPNLYAVKQDSIVFANHYTPAYITAGTFNTEFMVNSGLLPGAAGVSPSVYSRNDFPCSLPRLFLDKGYTANSFHGSDGSVYNREAVHKNLGYQAYHSGADMGMENYTLDSQLDAGFDLMLPESPFFTFIITYSGHGPYGDTNPIYLAHEQEAKEKAQSTEGNYVYAVAHAMETDVFVKELMDELERSGHLDDTVVVFYADHYNYYMLNDALTMIIKGVDSLNMLQHTDFFIYSAGTEPMTVDKYTSSIDLLPTLSNLFGLDAQYGLMTGDDAFSDGGGYVFFNDGTWTGSDADLGREIVRRREISGLILSGNYWAGAK